MTVRFTVDTLDNEKVTLHDIRVVTVRRSAPARGTLVSFACGGGGVYRFMSVDLDPDPPRRTFSVEETWIDMVEAHERKAIAFPYVVSAEDPESFWVFARVKRWDVDWVLEIDWSYQGRTGVTRVDDNGTPFRVTGGGGATAECRWGPDGGLLQEVSAAGCPTA